jgi:two-component system LytT family response regulator
MKVLIVDDEALAREGVRLALRQMADVQIVGEFDNGFDAVDAIIALQPDLVLLDIQMPGLNGIDVVARIGAARMPLVVFLTAYDRHAVEAFRVNALDYLLKPVADERFRESLDRARKALTERRLQEQALGLDRVLAQLSRRPEARPERLMIRTTGRVSFVRPGDITRVEAEGDYVMIHGAGKRHLVRETMKQMEERLAPYGFQRIHRSSLVNLDAVRELATDDNGDYHVILHDDTRLKLSRSCRDALYERLQNGAEPPPR